MDFINYQYYPARLICPIGTLSDKDRVNLGNKIALTPKKIHIASLNTLVSYLTHAELDYMLSCPTCPKKCPLTDLVGELDEDYASTMGRREDKARDEFIKICVDYLQTLLPYNPETLYYLLTKDADVNRIIRAAKEALTCDKSLEQCWHHLQPIKVGSSLKLTKEVIDHMSEDGKLNDYIRSEIAIKIGKWLLEKGLIDISNRSTDPSSNNIVIINCNLVFTKTFE